MVLRGVQGGWRGEARGVAGLVRALERFVDPPEGAMDCEGEPSLQVAEGGDRLRARASPRQSPQRRRSPSLRARRRVEHSPPPPGPPRSPGSPRLLDQVRSAIRVRHYSLRTEKSYVHWIRRFILFHGKRHPRELGAPEISGFLNHLAVEGETARGHALPRGGAALWLRASPARRPAPAGEGSRFRRA